jgi:hypothetical protein
MAIHTYTPTQTVERMRWVFFVGWAFRNLYCECKVRRRVTDKATVMEKPVYKIKEASDNLQEGLLQLCSKEIPTPTSLETMLPSRAVQNRK